MYVIHNEKTEQLLTLDGPIPFKKPYSGPMYVYSKDEAKTMVRKLARPEDWVIHACAIFFGESSKISVGPSTPPDPDPDDRYKPPSHRVAAKIEFKQGSHALVIGKVQSGKLEEKLEIIMMAIHSLGLPVLMLCRNATPDLKQFIKRRMEFNERQKTAGKPTLPVPIEVLTNRHQLAELIKSNSLIIGLANPRTIQEVDKCLIENPKLRKRLIIILDEADLVAIELRCKHTLTEQQLTSVFNKSFMLVSVTATPGVILLCDQYTKLHPTVPPDDYVGFDKIEFRPVEPKRIKSRSRQYDPVHDEENLTRIVGDVLKKPTGTLLIVSSLLKNDHRTIKDWLVSKYGFLGSDLVVCEFNEDTVKVVNGKGEPLPSEWEQLVNRKVGAIDKALQTYKDTPYIIIVAGKLAGRGISFVSLDYSRPLTHQYIADAAKCNLEYGMQAMRLLGRFQGNPRPVLYCSQGLYQDLQKMNKDMDDYIEIAIEARENDERMPDVLRFQNDYDSKLYGHHWLPNRKRTGTEYTMTTTSSTIHSWVVMTEKPERDSSSKKIWADSILTNTAKDFAAMLQGGVWPGFMYEKAGVHHGYDATKVVRWIYCNPREDFSKEGIKAYFEREDNFKAKKTNKKTRESLQTDGFKYYDSALALYKTNPEYEGNWLNLVETKKVAPKNQFVRRKPSLVPA